MFTFIAGSLAISIAILALVYFISRTAGGTQSVCVLSALGLFVSGPFGALVLILQCLLTLVGGIACQIVRAKPTSVFASSLAAAIASYALVIWIGYGQVRERAELRERYPVESLSDRLAYETRNQEDMPSSPVPLGIDAEQRLGAFENRGASNIRRYLLESLHDRTRDTFVMARGFGNARMMSVRKATIELPTPDPIPLPQPPYQPESVSSDKRARPLSAGDFDSDAPPAENQLMSLHTTGLEDFLAPERMGYVEDREHVAGFQSHAFQRIPAIDPSATEQSWQITRLELVSLLKHNVPRVYVSDHLPQMARLVNTSTRPLDEFEATALDQLRRSEDLVVENEVNRIRMLGSLRAGTDCLECHSVQRGALLGAFSYDLFRLRPKPILKPKKPAKPQA